MSAEEIIRAWKEPDRFVDAEGAPPHPAGVIDTGLQPEYYGAGVFLPFGYANLTQYCNTGHFLSIDCCY